MPQRMIVAAKPTARWATVRRNSRPDTDTTGGPGQEIELAPFHRIADERYSLYWQLA